MVCFAKLRYKDLMNHLLLSGQNPQNRRKKTWKLQNGMIRRLRFWRG